MMQTPEATWDALKNGPIYMDFDSDVPAKVWVVEHELFAKHRALEVKPYEGVRGLVWSLVEATCISRSSSGINVTFFKSGGTGWFPLGNACLPE